MNTKLTLTLEKDIIIQAKKYAELKRQSLSDIIENFLKYLTSSEQDSEELGVITKSLYGSFPLNRPINYKEEIQDYLLNKYNNEKHIS